MQQSVSLLQKDKEYLHRQNTELKVHLAQEQERGQRLQVQLDDTNKAREDTYERYVASRCVHRPAPPLVLGPVSPVLVYRDQNRCEYESRLKAELESIRLQTSVELENLQRSSREVFERENR